MKRRRLPSPGLGLPFARNGVRVLAALLLLSGPAAAEWGWYSGDIARFDGRNTAGTVPERVQQSLEAGLDWVVLTANPGEGAFVGLADIIQEIELNTPRITPIAGTQWEGEGREAVLFGIDPRAPLPVRASDIVATTESHRGVSVFPGLAPERTESNAPASGTAFTGLLDGVWHPEVEPGGAWDAALSAGHRIYIVGASDTRPPGTAQKTYVWAEASAADQVVGGIRRGRAYVAEGDGIHVDLQVNGSLPGSTVFFGREPYIRLRAHARAPISRVLLVADGDVVWSTSPNDRLWEERFFLPLLHHTYVRAILESDVGGFRTMVNPVFLVSEPADGAGEVPLEHVIGHDPDPFLELGGVVEAVVNLDLPAQRLILAEFLANPAMRYPTVWLLQNRADLISDELLLDLLATDSVEVRLGAAYAIAARATEELADVFPRMLSDPEPRIRAYAARLVSQFTGGLGDSRMLNAVPADDVIARAYLIRAYAPARHDESVVSDLIRDLGSPHRAVSAAAMGKLVELGTRDYRIIQALLDAGDQGQAHALEAAGRVGDRRAVSRLGEILERHAHGPTHREAFLALASMDAPYGDRKRVICPSITPPPVLDGVISPGEWDAAAILRDFVHDNDATPANRAVTAFLARDERYLFLAVQAETDPTVRSAVRDPEGAGIESDGRIELDLTLSADPSARLRLLLNALGVMRREAAATLTFGADVRTASTRGPNTWSTEWAVPITADGGSRPGSLRFNLAIVPADTTEARLAWSVTYGSPEDPDRHGELVLGEPRTN